MLGQPWQNAPTWCLSPNMEPMRVAGGPGVENGACFLQQEGRGEADITAEQAFKPLTQPAPHPVCPSPDRAESFLHLRAL